jgi:hypothetical protein
MIGPTPNSSISSLDKATQLSLATVLFIGITTCWVVSLRRCKRIRT